MAGVYIKYIDGDDVYNACKCVDEDDSQKNNLTFPGASMISFGSQWKMEDDFRICEKFGEPQVVITESTSQSAAEIVTQLSHCI